MDDHLFDEVYSYGMSELVPRFQKEFNKYGLLNKCPSFEEIKDFCKVLNLIEKWDYTKANKTIYQPYMFVEF